MVYTVEGKGGLFGEAMRTHRLAERLDERRLDAPCARRRPRGPLRPRAEGQPRRAGVPGHAPRGDDGQCGDDASTAQRGGRCVGPRVPLELQGLGARARRGRAALGRSSRRRTSRARRPSPPMRATISLRSAARSGRRGPTAFRRRGGFRTGHGPLIASSRAVRNVSGSADGAARATFETPRSHRHIHARVAACGDEGCAHNPPGGAFLGGRVSVSECQVDPDHDHVGVRRPVAVSAVGDDSAPLVPDTAAADEV